MGNDQVDAQVQDNEAPAPAPAKKATRARKQTAAPAQTQTDSQVSDGKPSKPAARGKKALDAKDYETAIEEFTAAIKESPTSPDFFIQRSIAHQRARKFDEALADAEQAVLNAQKRAKKESIVEGQLRRGIALHSLGRYADADFTLALGKFDSNTKGIITDS